MNGDMSMAKGIRLSEKHGVNPTIPRCYFCNEPKNEIILCGYIKGDAEAPKNVVFDKNPCDNCKKLMEQGIMLIAVRDGESGDNPYRTGQICVVTREAAERIFNEVPKCGAGFVEESIWKHLGLPTA